MAASAASDMPFIVKISASLDSERRALAVFGDKHGDAWIGLAASGARICGCASFGYKALEKHLTTPGIKHVCPGCTGCHSTTDASATVGAGTNGSVVAARTSASDAVVKRLGSWWPAPATILDIGREGWCTTRLYSALMQTGASDSLGDASETAQKYTLFAPNDSAFARIREMPQGEALLDVLRQHLVLGVHTAQSVPLNGSIVALQSVGGTTITLERNTTTGNIVVNGIADVTWKDLHATNGVVHVISRVLPVLSADGIGAGMGVRASAPTPASVLDVIATNDNATVFRAFLARTFANTKELAAPGAKYTIFVPVDASFADVETEDMPASSDDLNALIQGHSVRAEVKPSHFEEKTRVRTLNGASLCISASDTHCYVNGSRVTETVRTDNGVVYFVEKLLQ